MKKLIFVAIILILLTGLGQTQTGTVILRWTAPGDDGWIGQAAAYRGMVSMDSAQLINNFDNCQVITGMPSPSIAGARDSVCISNIPSGVRYWVAIKTLDEAFNISLISNIPRIYRPDTECPGRITDIEVEIK